MNKNKGYHFPLNRWAKKNRNKPAIQEENDSVNE